MPDYVVLKRLLSMLTHRVSKVCCDASRVEMSLAPRLQKRFAVLCMLVFTDVHFAILYVDKGVDNSKAFTRWFLYEPLQLCTAETAYKHNPFHSHLS